MNERKRWLVWGGFVLGVVTLVGWWLQPVPGSEGVTADQPGKSSGIDTSVSLASEQGAARFGLRIWPRRLSQRYCLGTKT